MPDKITEISCLDAHYAVWQFVYSKCKADANQYLPPQLTVAAHAPSGVSGLAALDCEMTSYESHRGERLEMMLHRCQIVAYSDNIQKYLDMVAHHATTDIINGHMIHIFMHEFMHYRWLVTEYHKYLRAPANNKGHILDKIRKQMGGRENPHAPEEIRTEVAALNFMHYMLIWNLNDTHENAHFEQVPIFSTKDLQQREANMDYRNISLLMEYYVYEFCAKYAQGVIAALPSKIVQQWIDLNAADAKALCPEEHLLHIIDQLNQAETDKHTFVIIE